MKNQSGETGRYLDDLRGGEGPEDPEEHEVGDVAALGPRVPFSDELEQQPELLLPQGPDDLLHRVLGEPPPAEL